MRKITVLLFCLLLTAISVRAQQITTAIVTVTNTAGTTNGMSFNLNGNVWVFTNAVNSPCSQALNGTNIARTATNLWTALISCPQVNLNQTFNGSNGVTIFSSPGSALTATISGAWGTVTYVTNTITQATVVRVPPAAVGNYEKTNVESGLAQYLGDNRGTNTVGTNAFMFSPWWTWISSISASAASGSTNSWSLQGNTGASGAVLGTMDGNALTLVADGNKMLVFDGVDQNFTFNTNNPIYNGRYHVILQGMSNEIAGVGNQYSIICDGLQNNNFANEFGFIGTGTGNQTLSYPFETILNGSFNTAHGNWTTILNGSYNYIGGPTSGSQYSTVLDGTGNYIAPNNYNDTIFVGNSNTINGSYSAAGGMNCNVQNNSVFMWSDNEPTPFNSAQSNTFLIRAQNGAAINTTNPAGYTLNVNGTINASGYYLNGAIFGGGTGGGGSNSASGAVGSLYNVNLGPGVAVNGYAISNVTVTGNSGSYNYLNGTYYAQTSLPGNLYTFNFGGNSYTGWYSYTNTTGSFSWEISIGGAFYISPHWSFPSVGPPSPPAQNFDFNLVDPNFNENWQLLLVAGLNPDFTPVLSPIGTNTSYSASATITWGFGDNWNVSMTGVTNINLSLAQDWKTTNSTQVETHKIFLNSATNTCSLVFSQTNLWLWQNRQGLTAAAPTSLSSNETMTITLHHLGTYTNWLATWDTTAAVGGGTGGLSVTNWTTSSPAGGSVYATNTVYSYAGPAAIFWGTTIPTSPPGSVIIYYTNNAVGYSNYIYNTAGGSGIGSLISFPLNSGSTFCFQTPYTTCYFTNSVIWALPH